jgi:hypothetical protein
MVEAFYGTSLTAIAVTTFALFLVFTEASFRLGRRRWHPGRESEGQVEPVLGGLIGLLGLLVAFTFSMAGARYDLRRMLLLDHANAIKVAYLRADLLSETERDQAQGVLRRYVDVQLDAFTPHHVPLAIAASRPLLAKLWSIATAAAEERPTVISSLFVQSINAVSDVQDKRIELAWHNHLPPSILGTLYVVALLTLAVMGFEGGLSGKHRPVAAPVLAVALATVVLVIIDLDRPFEGLLRNNPRPLLDLRDEIASTR